MKVVNGVHIEYVCFKGYVLSHFPYSVLKETVLFFLEVQCTLAVSSHSNEGNRDIVDDIQCIYTFCFDFIASSQTMFLLKFGYYDIDHGLL